MSRKSYNRSDRFFLAVISVLCLCAAALVIAIAVQSKLNVRRDVPVQAEVEISDSTPAPMRVVSVDTRLTPTPEAEATPQPTPAPTEVPFEYLPVYTKADTQEKVIAITLDDCTDLECLKYAASAAQHYGAKLTLLPVAGEFLGEDHAAALRTCVLEMGFQVENRTLNNSSLYALDDFQMANQIWTADTAVDYILNKDYSMHLLRPKGGQGLKDPRTHAYLKQLGYDGFLTWSVSAAGVDVDELKSGLRPGDIYLFNSTKEEVLKMAEFMQFAKRRGYQMVTVNELLGFAENACADTTENIMARQLPELNAADIPMQQYSVGDRAHGVYRLQVMLAELGYLRQEEPTAAPDGTVPGIAYTNLTDGVYGTGTGKAVMQFQASRGWPCTGVATVELQKELEAEYQLKISGR